MKDAIQNIVILLLFFLANSCKSQLHSLPANYSDDYIKAYSGKFTVEIPEVQELVHIVIALTPRGINDSDLVEHRTSYYKEVMNYFSAFKSHLLVESVEKLIRTSISKYAKLKMSSCNYYFKNNNIIKDTLIENIGWDNTNYTKKILHSLEDFAYKSNFRAFYKSHQPYYDSLIQAQKKLVPLVKQWKWLENNFPEKYHSYRIIFSCLANGSHSTARFEGNNFKQMMMFICPPFQYPNFSESINEALISKIVFTEVDHNYINPISAEYMDEVNTAFAKRLIWTKGGNSNDYNSPYAVFNEYMTFAVFLLYCHDIYQEIDYKLIKAKTEFQVSNLRGFINFKAFNESLLLFYLEKKETEKVSDLYSKILGWCKKQIQ